MPSEYQKAMTRPASEMLGSAKVPSVASLKRNALEQVMHSPTVDIAVAASVLNIGLSAAYKARRDGTIPSVKIGRLYRIPTAPLRKMLGIAEQEPAANAA